MKESLFSEFPKVSTKEWKQKIQFDLKGRDYNETLIWQSPEGINVKPFYNSDDLPSAIENSEFKPWKILQTIFVADVEKSNQKAINLATKGVQAICFIIPNAEVDYKTLLDGIDFESIQLQFKFEFLASDYIVNLKQFISESIQLKSFSKDIIIHTDIIGNLARTGNWNKDLKSDHIQFEAIVKETQSITVDVGLYQNAGANMVQELAYALAHLNEYLNHLEKNHLDLTVVFNVAIGSNYFFEIAKLKALRILFKTLAKEYSIDAGCVISASPTKRNKTLYDYNTNMLRTTSECMSAILGGANFVENLPYDAIYHKSNKFGERIARNQPLILRNESYFDEAQDASNGSFYIESLVNQLAQKGLELFKDIERNGGFLKQLKDGKIQEKIKESAGKEQDAFNSEKLKLVGTNYHVNQSDKMKDELELFPFVKHKPRKTLLNPIIEKRLSEKSEQLRLNLEAEK